MYLGYAHLREYTPKWNDGCQTMKQLKRTRHKVKAVNKQKKVEKEEETHIHTYTHTHTLTPA